MTPRKVIGRTARGICAAGCWSDGHNKKGSTWTLLSIPRRKEIVEEDVCGPARGTGFGLMHLMPNDASLLAVYQVLSSVSQCVE